MRKIHAITGAWCVFVLLLTPLKVLADPLPALPPLIISEVQPGTVASAAEEFIELYNTTSEPINLSDHVWILQIASQSASTWNDLLRNVTLTGIVPPHGYYVVASTYGTSLEVTKYLPAVAAQWFSAAIAAPGGHVRLVYKTHVPRATGGEGCDMATTTVDQVEWSVLAAGAIALPSIDVRQVYIAPTGGLVKGTSLQRVAAATGEYRDGDNDAVDFIAAQPTVAAPSLPPVSELSAPTDVVQPSLPVHTCDPNPPAVPPEPEPSEPPSPPADTGSGGTDTGTPPADLPAEPTPLLPVQITEVLPNPAAPQTDDHDEFIELFNPNTTPYDLSGFILETGEATKHRYTLPAGTILGAQQYGVWYSAETGLSLSNAGSRVSLLDTTNVVIATSEGYVAAPDGQSWALSGGMWQWTTMITAGLQNVITVPQLAAKKPAAEPKPKKPAAVKAATVKQTKTTTKAAKDPKPVKTPPAQLAAASEPARSPLHMGVLATIGVIAVLYGLYEYRHDITNKLLRLRGNRINRGKNRAPVTRR
jgi:hypothetical protein